MKTRLILALCLLSWLIALPAGAAPSNKNEALLASQVVCTDAFSTGGPPQSGGSPDGLCDDDGSTSATTTGGTVSVTTTSRSGTQTYLVVKTSAETATASLVVEAYLVNGLGNTLICQLAAITTDTTTTAILGTARAANLGIQTACDFPLGRAVVWEFTVTGAAADFTVEAELEWVASEAN